MLCSSTRCSTWAKITALGVVLPSNTLVFPSHILHANIATRCLKFASYSFHFTITSHQFHQLVQPILQPFSSHKSCTRMHRTRGEMLISLSIPHHGQVASANKCRWRRSAWVGRVFLPTRHKKCLTFGDTSILQISIHATWKIYKSPLLPSIYAALVKYKPSLENAQVKESSWAYKLRGIDKILCWSFSWKWSGINSELHSIVYILMSSLTRVTSSTWGLVMNITSFPTTHGSCHMFTCFSSPMRHITPSFTNALALHILLQD